MTTREIPRVAGRWFYRFAAFLGFLHLTITFTPVLGWWVSALSAPWDSGGGGTLIVLGGDKFDPHIPGYSSYKRSYYAALVWRERRFAHVIVTGREIAGGMRDIMVAFGVPRDVIVVEDEAESTRENALFVASLLRDDSGPRALLTSDYHSLRATRTFRKAGIAVAPLPFPDARQQLNGLVGRWGVFVNLTMETTKTAYYLARGWI